MVDKAFTIDDVISVKEREGFVDEFRCAMPEAYHKWASGRATAAELWKAFMPGLEKMYHNEEIVNMEWEYTQMSTTAMLSNVHQEALKYVFGKQIRRHEQIAEDRQVIRNGMLKFNKKCEARGWPSAFTGSHSDFTEKEVARKRQMLPDQFGVKEFLNVVT